VRRENTLPNRQQFKKWFLKQSRMFGVRPLPAGYTDLRRVPRGDLGVPDSLTFAVDVFRTVCDRFRAKAADLRLLVEGGSSFEAWLHWEAYLACKLRQEVYPFCEVAANPTYASEGVTTEAGDADSTFGDLRVGGPNDGADHCWLFAEIVLAGGDENADRDWVKRAEAATGRLKRLGWKKSAALLIVVMVSRTYDRPVGVADTANEVWNRPALTDPCVIPLPGGRSVVVKAFDIKRNPADVHSTGR
jgi:hypothetical protein